LSFKPVQNVAAHGFPRKQCEVLKDDAAVRSRTGDLLAINQDRSGFHRQKAADEIEQRRLAATGWTKQGDKLAIGYFKRDLIERKHLASARRTIEVIYLVDNDLRRCGHVAGKRP
jgi:hypothetical protein